MTIEKLKEKYSVDLRLNAFEQNISNIDKTLISIENRLEKMDTKIESRFEKTDSKFDSILNEIKNINNDLRTEISGSSKELRAEIKNNFFWTLALIFGIYGAAFGAMVGFIGRTFHWF